MTYLYEKTILTIDLIYLYEKTIFLSVKSLIPVSKNNVLFGNTCIKKQ